MSDIVERLRKRREAELIGGYERVEWEDEEAIEAADTIDDLRAEIDYLRTAIAIVLEEAAKVAEAFPARTHGNLATAPYAAAEQAGDEIAAAIRKLGEQK